MTYTSMISEYCEFAEYKTLNLLLNIAIRDALDMRQRPQYVAENLLDRDFTATAPNESGLQM